MTSWGSAFYLDDYPEYYRDIFTRNSGEFSETFKIDIRKERIVVRLLVFARRFLFNVGIFILITQFFSEEKPIHYLIGISMILLFEFGDTSRKLSGQAHFIFDMAMTRMVGAFAGLTVLSFNHSFPAIVTMVDGVGSIPLCIMAPLPFFAGVTSYSLSKRYVRALGRAAEAG